MDRFFAFLFVCTVRERLFRVDESKAATTIDGSTWPELSLTSWTRMGIQDRGYYQDDEWKPDAQRSARSVTVTLIIINVVVFVADMFSGVAYETEQGDKVQWVSNALAIKAETPWAVWQWITYGFAHSSIQTKAGIFHIAFNMIALFFFGRAMEQNLGRSEFLKFYLLAIIFSGLIWLGSQLMQGNTAAKAVGASGAVTAVVMWFVFNYPREVVMLLTIPMPAWLLGVILIGANILGTLGSQTTIAVEAHLGGALFAAGYFYFKWNFRWLKTEWIADRFSGKPRLKVHNPSRREEQLNALADAILEKVHLQGEESLTRKERKILEQYSRRVRRDRDN